MNPIVTSAISHLKDLEQTMRLEGSNFKTDDIENCDEVAELLHQLEKQVKEIHDEYEIQTIKGNILRHRVSTFKMDFKKEVDENVKAARDSNMEVILLLKAKLNELIKNIEKLHERDQELSDEINRMQPERDALEETHRSIMNVLNKHMADKAKAQIKLNETRDVLRDTNQAALDLEDEMISLKESLVKERQEARDEKARLEEEKKIKNKKAASQEEFNQNKLREVEVVKKRLDESNMSLRSIFRENERLEQLNAQLSDEIEKNTNELNKAQKELESLVVESLRLASLDAQTEQDYQDNKKKTIEKTKETIARTETEGERLKVLKEEQDVKREELRGIYEKYNELQRDIGEIRKIIEKMKAEMGIKLQEIADLEAKNRDILKQLTEAQETHSQVMESLHREADELKEQVIHERDLRVQKQQEREALLREIDAFNSDFVDYQAAMNKYFGDSREKYEFLTQKEKDLTESIAVNEKVVVELREKYANALNGFNTMKETLEKRLKTLEEETVLFTAEKAQFEDVIKDLTPAYDDLCKVYADKTHDYDEVRKKLIYVKTKKQSLENNITKTQEKTKMHETSREDYKLKLVELREKGLKQMKEQNEEKKNLEDVILGTGVKLETLRQENDRFIQAIRNFEKEYQHMTDTAVEQMQNKVALQNEYSRIHQQLLDGWRSDAEIEQLFDMNDTKLVEKINNLMNKVQTRCLKVNNLSGYMYREVDYLDKYLNKMIRKSMDSNELVKKDDTKDSESNDITS